MLRFTYIILFLWCTLAAMPAFAAIKGVPACCTDCPGGHCPINKAPKKETAHGPACHMAAKTQKCSMKSNGCDHEKPQLVFLYDAVLQNEDSRDRLIPESKTLLADFSLDAAYLQIDPPPPKHLL